MKDAVQFRVFISYSHRAKGPEWKAALLPHLSVFTAQDLFDAWDDEQIPGGWRWEKEIEKAIRDAQLAVVLLTKEALESEFILQRELAPLSHREKDGLIVIPILCEPCGWNDHPWLKQVQIRPFEAKPLSTFDQRELGSVFRKLATDIAREFGRVALAANFALHAPRSELKTYLDKFPLTRGPGLCEEKLINDCGYHRRDEELADAKRAILGNT